MNRAVGFRRESASSLRMYAILESGVSRSHGNFH